MGGRTYQLVNRERAADGLWVVGVGEDGGGGVAFEEGPPLSYENRTGAEEDGTWWVGGWMGG